MKGEVHTHISMQVRLDYRVKTSETQGESACLAQCPHRITAGRSIHHTSLHHIQRHSYHGRHSTLSVHTKPKLKHKANDIISECHLQNSLIRMARVRRIWYCNITLNKICKTQI